MTRAEQPSAASDGPIDFTATRSVSNDYCNDYITILSTVRSPSNTKPTQVLAEFNGANITMKAPRIKIDGDYNGKNYIDGITYYAFVKSPPTGPNNLTIHVGNASGWYSTIQSAYQYNKTSQLASASVFLTSKLIAPTKYLFVVSTSIHLFTCIERVFVSINGTEYDMVRDPELFIGQYRYEHDFGTSDSNREWECQATVVYPGGNKTSNNNTIDLSAQAEISDVMANILNTEYKTDTRKINLRVFYYDAKNRAPNDLILEINGANQTMSRKPYNEKKFGQSASNYALGPLYIGSSGEQLEDHSFELNYSTLYNISIWYNNGTWQKKQIYTNYNSGPKPALVSAPSFTHIHSAFAFNGTHATVNVTFNVTSNVPNFRLFDNTEIQINIRGPEINVNKMVEEADPSDTSFADGKTYTINTTIWTGVRDYWGSLLVNITLKYGNDSFSTNAPFNRIYPTIIINRTNGKAATYGIKGNEILIYKTTTKILKCCAQMYESSIYRTQYNLTTVERYLNSDYIKIYGYWLEKKYNSSEYGVYLEYSSDAFFNDDLDNQPNGGLIAVPLNHPARLAQYLNNLAVDAQNVEYKKDFLTGLMTVSYKESFGDFKYEHSTTWDKRGILRNQIQKIYIGDTLISETISELETTFMDLLFLDYLWYIIIGGGIVLIAIVAVIIKKKRA